MARALHEASGRADGPWVEFDAHALHIATAETPQVPDVYPQTAIPTAFKMARGGTLVIDRLEDAELQAQAQLLAQLKGLMLASEYAWDMGVITTLAAEPEELSRSGRVAHSLLDLLQVGLILVPPLRERREDIPLLLHHFLDQVLKQRGGWTERASTRAHAPWLGLPLIGELLAHRAQPRLLLTTLTLRTAAVAVPPAANAEKRPTASLFSAPEQRAAAAKWPASRRRRHRRPR